MTGNLLRSRAGWIVALVALLSTSACSNPIQGEWQSDQKLGNGERNALWFYKDGSGEATLYATPVGQPDNWIRFDFQTDWTEFSGSVFDVDMECDDDDCSGNDDDFTLECDGVDEGNDSLKLDCKGDGKWAQYPFNWEKL